MNTINFKDLLDKLNTNVEFTKEFLIAADYDVSEYVSDMDDEDEVEKQTLAGIPRSICWDAETHDCGAGFNHFAQAWLKGFHLEYKGLEYYFVTTDNAEFDVVVKDTDGQEINLGNHRLNALGDLLEDGFEADDYDLHFTEASFKNAVEAW